MTAASLRLAVFLALAAIGLILHAAAEHRRDRIERDRAQMRRAAARAVADQRVAGGAR